MFKSLQQTLYNNGYYNQAKSKGVNIPRFSQRWWNFSESLLFETECKICRKSSILLKPLLLWNVVSKVKGLHWFPIIMLKAFYSPQLLFSSDSLGYSVYLGDRKLHHMYFCRGKLHRGKFCCIIYFAVRKLCRKEISP